MRPRTLLGTGTVAALTLTGLVAVPAHAVDPPVINEFSTDIQSSDTGAEYIEVLGSPNATMSGYRLLTVEGDPNTRQGTVISSNPAPALNDAGFGSIVPSSFQNGSVSVVLIQGTASVGQQLDANSDGVIDPSERFTVVDAVGVLDTEAGAVAYGTALAPNFDGGAATVGGASRVPDGTDTDAPGDWVRNAYNGAGLPGKPETAAPGLAYNTPGAPNRVAEQTPPPPPPVGATCGSNAVVTIGSVQGSGETTPRAGQTVTVEGVVIGDWQDAGSFNGFHLQDAGDGIPATSDGIFVYAPGGAAVDEGDRVQVTGTVEEYGGQTQLSGVTVLECGEAALPTPVAVQLPTDERQYESMLVTMTQSLPIIEYFDYDRYGSVVVGTERQFTPTAVAAPNSPESAAVRAANLANRITIDDGRAVQNPDVLIHPGNLQPFSLENRFRGGDTVTGITGVLEFRFGAWAIQPTEAGTFQRANPRPVAPEIEGASLEISSFNVLNYFTTLNSRGARTPAEFERQESKIVAAINELDSAVVGLSEIENNNGQALTTLVAALNEDAGATRWAGIATGRLGTDEITNALIYQPALVTPEGAFAALDPSVDPRFAANNRPALAQSFRDIADDRVVTVSVNHLKSKGSECAGQDPNDEQGSCNEVRTAAAAALAEWIASDPTEQDPDGSLIIGDLNSYDYEDPITTLERAGWTDLLKRHEGDRAYSYVFDGQLGYLDHGLADRALLPHVEGAAVWHANADEPDILDYTTQRKSPAQIANLFEPNPYRASDHDAVVIGLDWAGAEPGPDPDPEPVEPTVEDYAGNDRYASNVAASEALFEPGADVIIASGQIFADALAAGPAAARAGASLLLTPGAALQPVTAAELERLQPGSVTIVGGQPSVSSAVAEQITEIVPEAEVRRIAGADRYATAAKIADEYFEEAEQAFIASGENFPDAVSASGVASVIGDTPVLLTPSAQVSEHTVRAIDDLGVAQAELLGSRVTITDDVVRAYREQTWVVRVAGSDRYATNAMLVNRHIEAVDEQAIAIASGTNFPDALSASMVSGVHGAPVLLAAGSCVTLAVADQIERLEPTRVFNVGGLPTLSPDAWRTAC